MKTSPVLAVVVCIAGIAQLGFAADDLILPGTVAVVEGTEIKDSEVTKVLNTSMKKIGKKLADLTEAERLRTVRTVVEELITKQLIKTRCAGVKVPDADVEKRYDQFVEKASGLEKFHDLLQSFQTTEEDFKEEIRERFREQKWFADSLFGQGMATEADAKAYYDANPTEFEQPEQVRASHILVTVAPGSPTIVQAQRFKIAQAAADRIGKGEDFGKVAAEVSEDPRNNQKGGDLGYFTRKATPPEIVDIAFALRKGRVSKIVITNLGFHIIKRTGYKAASKQSFRQAEESIRSRLTAKNQNELGQKLINDLRSKANVTINLPAE